MAKSVTVPSQLLPSGSRPRTAVPGLPLLLVLQRGGCRASWLPPGWNSVAYFKLACTRSQQLQLGFFPHFICPRALRGGEEEGGAAPACSAASSSPAPAVVRLPAEMVVMVAACNEPAARCSVHGGEGGGVPKIHLSKHPAFQKQHGAESTSMPRAHGVAAWMGRPHHGTRSRAWVKSHPV